MLDIKLNETLQEQTQDHERSRLGTLCQDQECCNSLLACHDSYSLVTRKSSIVIGPKDIVKVEVNQQTGPFQPNQSAVSSPCP